MNFFKETKTEVLKELGANPKNGLSLFEVEARRSKFGENKLPMEKKSIVFLIFLRQLSSPLVLILAAAIVISYFLGEYIDMWVIIAALIMDIGVGYWQEKKASNALEALKKIVAWNAKVLREGKIRQINSEELVPGDIVMLKAGDRIPADARVIHAEEFSCDEASLTGESISVSKFPESIKKSSDVPIAERQNMVYMGTLALAGSARAVVTDIGVETEFGKIARMMKETKDTATPLQRRIQKFTKWLGVFAGLIVAAILIVGVLTGENVTDMFTTAVAVAVSAIPEGLLSSIIIVLALGVYRMSKKNALIRRLQSAETLGSATVICTDKTGTLTEGKMMVVEIYTHVCSHGEGCIFKASDVRFDKERMLTLQIAMLNNDAYIENPEDSFARWKVIGDPTERALLVAATQVGLKRDDLEKVFPRLGELPFNSSQRYMATLHDDTDHERRQIFIKGAGEKVIPMCDKIFAEENERKIDDSERKHFIKKYEEMSKRGLRVLVFAYKKAHGGEIDLRKQVSGFTLVGLVGMKDPLREGVKRAIAKTQQAGIKVMMLSGDHKYTARAIASELGLPVSEKNIVEGKEIQLVDGTVVHRNIKDISVFARVSPGDKLHIVSSLQKHGDIVAMTGDGVNDAPSLKKADIGIALGSGTDVTKEAADMVLLDDNYKSIEEAVEEGRGIFENIRKVVLYLLSDSFAEVIIIVGAMIIGMPIPLLATQILWVNLVDDGLPDVALASEPKEEGLMDEPPRKPSEPLLNFEMKLLIGVISVVSAVVLLVLFSLYLESGYSLDHARTMAFSVIAVNSLLYVFSVRSMRHTIFHKHFFRNKWLFVSSGLGLVLQLFAVYFSPLQKVFHTVPLGWEDWKWILLAAAIVIALIEFIKMVFIRKSKKVRTL